MRPVLWLMLVLAILGSCPSGAQGNDPKAVVGTFYEWYLKHQEHARDLLAEQKSVFASTLYDPLMIAFKSKDNVVDFDPFDNAQMDARQYQIGKVQMQGRTALVPVSLQLSRPGQSSLIVVVKQTGSQWQIADFVYPAESGVKSWTLSKFLNDNLKKVH